MDSSFEIPQSNPPQPFENYLQLWRPAFRLENSWLYSWTLLNFPFIPWTSFICKPPLLLMLDLLPVSDCKNLHIWWISASSGGRRGLDATSGIYQNRPQKPSTDVGQRQSKIFGFVLKRLFHRMYSRRNKAQTLFSQDLIAHTPPPSPSTHFLTN